MSFDEKSNVAILQDEKFVNEQIFMIWDQFCMGKVSTREQMKGLVTAIISNTAERIQAAA